MPPATTCNGADHADGASRPPSMPPMPITMKITRMTSLISTIQSSASPISFALNRFRPVIPRMLPLIRMCFQNSCEDAGNKVAP